LLFQSVFLDPLPLARQARRADLYWVLADSRQEQSTSAEAMSPFLLAGETTQSETSPTEAVFCPEASFA